MGVGLQRGSFARDAQVAPTRGRLVLRQRDCDPSSHARRAEREAQRRWTTGR